MATRRVRAAATDPTASASTRGDADRDSRRSKPFCADSRRLATSSRVAGASGVAGASSAVGERNVTVRRPRDMGVAALTAAGVRGGRGFPGARAAAVAAPWARRHSRSKSSRLGPVAGASSGRRSWCRDDPSIHRMSVFVFLRSILSTSAKSSVRLRPPPA